MIEEKLKNKIVFVIISLVVIISLINLPFIPIAWVDEIMDLDPALNWVKGLGFQSELWPYKGSENLFLANLPLRNLPFVLSTYLMGNDIFWVRFPHFIFWVVSALILFKIIAGQNAKSLAWIIVFLFVFDKAIYESMRAVRPEMFQVLLMLASLYFLTIKQKPLVSLIFSSFLILTHPASWMLALVLAFFALKDLPKKDRILGFSFLILPTLIWLSFIKFDFKGIQNQLLAAGQDHSNTSWNPIVMLKNHFVVRFMNYSNYQAWIWFLVLTAHYIAFRNIRLSQLNNQTKRISILLVLHSAYWMFFLAPNYRYNPTLILLCFILIAPWLRVIFESPKKIRRIGIRFLLFLHAIPIIFIFGAGLIQRQERNPYQALDWLHSIEIPKNKSLLCGESIGYYYASNYSELSYCEPNYPHKFNFENYENLYLLTYDSIDAPSLSSYSLAQSKLSTKIPALTYNGLKLYKVTPTQLKAYCLKIRNGDAW